MATIWRDNPEHRDSQARPVRYGANGKSNRKMVHHRRRLTRQHHVAVIARPEHGSSSQSCSSCRPLTGENPLASHLKRDRNERDLKDSEKQGASSDEDPRPVHCKESRFHTANPSRSTTCRVLYRERSLPDMGRADFNYPDLAGRLSTLTSSFAREAVCILHKPG